MMSSAVALRGLRASFHGGNVRINWQVPPNAPEAVHIYSVKGVDANGNVELDKHILVKYLYDCNGGAVFPYSVYDVCIKKVSFCVFLSGYNYQLEDIRGLKQRDGCFVSVIIGEAHVRYDIKSKSCGNGLAAYTIRIVSPEEIDLEILGYTYNFYGKMICVEFPGRIQNGATEYPPIYLPQEVCPDVSIIGDAVTCLTISHEKIPFFRWLFMKKAKPKF